MKKEKFEAGRQIKGRNEPCNIVQVAEVLAGVRQTTVDDLARQCYENTCRLFWPGCRGAPGDNADEEGEGGAG